MSISAIRTSVALTNSHHIAAVSVTGPGRFELIDRVSTSELLIHESEILPSLLLDAEGTILADIEICRASDSLLIFAEGMTPETLADHLADHRPPGIAADIQNLGESHAILSLNGPYAWELLSELVGPGVLGQPYLTFFHEDRWTCFRAGKTGERGYHLLMTIDIASDVTSQILDQGSRFDIASVGIDELDRGQLENGTLCMRAHGVTGYNPFELQQQWRMSSTREYVGSQAVRACQGSDVARRSVYLASTEPLTTGCQVVFGEDAVGTILQAAYSAIREQWVASAVVERRFAYPGLSGLRACPLAKPASDGPGARGASDGSDGSGGPGAGSDVVTITAPMINNRSLYVNPRLHSYFTRDQVDFPPLNMDLGWIESGATPSGRGGS